MTNWTVIKKDWLGRTITTHVCCTKGVEFGYCARVRLGDGDILVNVFISVTSLVENVLSL